MTTSCLGQVRRISPGKTHRASYAAGIKEIQALGVPGPASDSAAALDRYLTTVGGALLSLNVLSADDMSVLNDDVPAGSKVLIHGSLSRASVATWLYLQAALFLTYEDQYETLIGNDYGFPNELGPHPWVTYLGWNGDITNQYALFSAKALGFPNFDASLQAWFGQDVFGDAPADSDLPTRALKDYYPQEYQQYTTSSGKGSAAPVPFCTGVTLKYLSEAIAPWFA